jgi:hypothetical protein
MFVKFSTGYGQLLMQGEPAVTLVRLGGHSGTVPSAVLAGDLPAFAAKLRAGLELHGDEPSPAPAAEETRRPEDDDDRPREQAIKLRLRAVPLLDMIDTALQHKSDLVWEQN